MVWCGVVWCGGGGGGGGGVCVSRLCQRVSRTRVNVFVCLYVCARE